jgi:hypothetical protein
MKNYILLGDHKLNSGVNLSTGATIRLTERQAIDLANKVVLSDYQNPEPENNITSEFEEEIKSDIKPVTAPKATVRKPLDFKHG